MRGERAQYRDRVRDRFARTGLADVLVEDVDKFIALAAGPTLLGVAGDMVVEVAGDPDLLLLHPTAPLDLLLALTRAAHIQGCPEEAARVWEQENLRAMVAASPSRETYRAATTYMDLLLEHGRHQQLLATFALLEEELVRSNLAVLLAQLAHYREGTAASLTAALRLLLRVQAGRRVLGRAAVAPALLAFNLGEHAKCLAILQVGLVRGRESLLHSSLATMAAARAGRLQEAVARLEALLPGPRAAGQPRRVVCYCALEAVVAAAAGTSELGRVMEVVEALEEQAEVREGALEELLFAPITPRARAVTAELRPDDLSSLPEHDDLDMS